MLTATAFPISRTWATAEATFPSLQCPSKQPSNQRWGDAGNRIQSVIERVAKLPPDSNGFRGAVLLQPGRYPVSGQIRIDTSGIVLRGSGTNSSTGTVLVATGTKRRSLIVIGKGGPQFSTETDDIDWPPAPTVQPDRSIRQITDDYVPIGARSFRVNSVTGLRVREEIVVKCPSTAEWIHEIGMDQLKQKRNGSVVQWQPGTKDLDFSPVMHIACEQLPTAQNWVIGPIAKSVSGDGFQESVGRNVSPQSLYAAQLRERLGDTGR